MMALPKTYYAKVMAQAFRVPICGEDGKPVPDLDANGNPKWNGTKKVYRTKLCKFTALSHNPKSAAGYVSQYVTGNDADVAEADEIRVLDGLVEDRQTDVISLEQYNREYRPVDTAKEEAAKAKAELEQAKAELEKFREEVERLKGEGAKRGPGRPPKEN